MAYKIVVDSCCDLTEDMKKWDNLEIIPLILQIGDYVTEDDKDFDQNDFIRRVSESNVLAKSACPSPEAFAAACDDDKYTDIYIITITDKLSGCYNSAVQGVELYKEEHGNEKNIHIFNSLSTSGTETIMAHKLKNAADSGMDFKDIVPMIEEYCVKNCGLYFCLESLDALKGNGRLFNLASNVIETLRVKLVCRRTEYGNISVAGKYLTEKIALAKLAGFVAKDTEGCDLTEKVCIISHVCCEEKADNVKKLIETLSGYSSENIIILKASGLNSLYACKGGIIVSYSK
ncbi:MAG: DegV family EDD domain-containing protein [Clostridiales bacterium]|nr:DegV family EDD domain-containing protein [Clostridiales bacterium]